MMKGLPESLNPAYGWDLQPSPRCPGGCDLGPDEFRHQRGLRLVWVWCI